MGKSKIWEPAKKHNRENMYGKGKMLGIKKNKNIEQLSEF